MAKPDCIDKMKSADCERCPWNNLCGDPPHDGAYYESLGYDLRGD